MNGNQNKVSKFTDCFCVSDGSGARPIFIGKRERTARPEGARPKKI